MAEEDLRVRAELAATGSLFEGYHPRMRAVHDRHASRLEQILAEHGWPSEPHVGADGCKPCGREHDRLQLMRISLRQTPGVGQDRWG
jgi:ribosomal protein S14